METKDEKKDRDHMYTMQLIYIWSSLIYYCGFFKITEDLIVSIYSYLKRTVMCYIFQQRNLKLEAKLIAWEHGNTEKKETLDQQEVKLATDTGNLNQRQENLRLRRTALQRALRELDVEEKVVETLELAEKNRRRSLTYKRKVVEKRISKVKAFSYLCNEILKTISSYEKKERKVVKKKILEVKKASDPDTSSANILETLSSYEKELKNLLDNDHSEVLREEEY